MKDEKYGKGPDIDKIKEAYLNMLDRLCGEYRRDRERKEQALLELVQNTSGPTEVISISRLNSDGEDE